MFLHLVKGKSLPLIFSLLFTSSLSYGEEVECCCDDYSDEYCNIMDGVRLEAQAGYFIFSDSKMRKIYNKGGLDLRLSTTFPIWRWLEGYGAVEYLQRRGHSLSSHQKTKIWELPVSVGLKSVIPIASIAEFYLTLGPRYIYLRQHNDSSYVNETIKRNVFGGFANTGFNFLFKRGFFLDAFAEYSYAKTHFHSSKANVYGRSIQVGGYAFGAGLGYIF